MRLAFAGFRHGHILEVHSLAAAADDVEIVAAAEAHGPTREELTTGGKVELTHESWRDMLDDVECDAVAVGEYFAGRGEIVLAALRSGRHVICDKPICTAADELDAIEAAVSETGLFVGCQFSLRDSAVSRTMRRLVGEGAIGPIRTITFTAQHPLRYGSRADWYFKPGFHGGTINDIAVHATDLIPWLTGERIAEVVAARAWNARLPQVPFFQDAAQLMLRLADGCGVLGDCSYLAPDAGGYSMPQYWRVTCHGDRGVLEGVSSAGELWLATSEDKAPRLCELDDREAGGYFQAFLREVRGESQPGDLTTRDVLTASRAALVAQQAADENRTGVAVP